MKPEHGASAGPIADTFDFWPFDIPPGTEFLAVYAVIALVGVILAKVVQVGLLSLLAPETRAQQDSQGYRDAWRKKERKLGVGAYPLVDDFLHVAHLRGDRPAVAEAVLVQAVAEGWLQPAQAPGMTAVYALPNDASSASRELAANIHATVAPQAQIKVAAQRVATNRAPDIERELVELGLLHSASARLWGRLAFTGVGAIVLAIGVIRALRGMELGRPVGFLVVEILAVAGAVFLLGGSKRRTDKGDAYVRWLIESTHSLRQDVWSGRTKRPVDVALAGAVTGLVAVPLVAALWPQQASAWESASASTFDSGSSAATSCSSSSCGGGGGCGSSGCGGGGGCGG